MTGKSQEWAVTAKRTFKSACRWFFGLIIMPALGLITAFFVWQYQNGKAVNALEAGIVARGEPLSPADLARDRPEIPIPPERNAAVPLLALWTPSDPEFWNAFREGQHGVKKKKRAHPVREIPVVGSGLENGEEYILPWPATNQLAAAIHLREKADYLAALRDAVALPDCRFPLRFEDGPWMELPHLAELRQDAELLVLSALHRLANGDISGAIEELGHAARIGSHLGGESLSISQASRLSIQEQTIAGITAVCGYGNPSAEELASLSRLMNRLQLNDDILKRTIVSERAMALPMADYDAALLSEEQGRDEPGLGSVMVLLRLSGFAKADHRFMLESFDQLIEISSHDYAERISELAAWKETVDETTGRFPPKFMSLLYVDGADRTLRRFARYEAIWRAATLAVAVEEYRQANEGKLKEKLAEMVPAEILEACPDPFNGEPMRLRLLENAYVIYSVGPDWTDNQGQLKKTSLLGNAPQDVGVAVDHRPRK